MTVCFEAAMRFLEEVLRIWKVLDHPIRDNKVNSARVYRPRPVLLKEMKFVYVRIRLSSGIHVHPDNPTVGTPEYT
jgi:hypothetical protein